MEKDLRELAYNVKGLNILMVSLLIGFEALRDLGKKDSGATIEHFKSH